MTNIQRLAALDQKLKEFARGDKIIEHMAGRGWLYVPRSGSAGRLEDNVARAADLVRLARNKPGPSPYGWTRKSVAEAWKRERSRTIR